MHDLAPKNHIGQALEGRLMKAHKDKYGNYYLETRDKIYQIDREGNNLKTLSQLPDCVDLYWCPSSFLTLAYALGRGDGIKDQKGESYE